MASRPDDSTTKQLLIKACVFSVALLTARDLAHAASGASGAGEITESLAPWLISASAAAFAAAKSWVTVGYHKHPIAVLAIAGGAALPFLSLGCSVSRAIRRLTLESGDTAAHDGPRSAPGLNRNAWLEINDGAARRDVQLGELSRVGAGEDCDIDLDSGDAWPGRCLIRRSPECEFHVLDIGDRAGSLSVNGSPARRARLRDGDVIDIEGRRLVFRQPPAWRAFPSTRSLRARRNRGQHTAPAAENGVQTGQGGRRSR